MNVGRKFHNVPYDYALDLVDYGRIEGADLLRACLRRMHPNEIQNMLIEMGLQPGGYRENDDDDG